MQHPDPSRSSPADSAASALLAEFLARVERGDSVDFDQFCAAHGERAVELRRLHAAWLEGSSALTGQPSEPAPPQPARLDAAAGPELERELERLVERGAARGRYRILDEVGRGGMGAVLRVWDEDLRRTLAMKVLHGAHSRDVPSRALRRFLAEAHVTGRLDHPGVVPLHELAFDADGRAYFTMKLVQGRTFSEVIECVHARRDAWTLTRALGVLLRVCETVAYAHERGVVHRDLKPANVMVGAFGEVYVMDWGLAHAPGGAEFASGDESSDQGERSPLRTRDGDVLGTPAYMAPEQAAGKSSEVGPAWDVYALGALLYHLLTARAPYAESTDDLPPRAILAQRVLGPPTSVHELAPDAPDELAAICAKAMAREPGQRYATALEFAADLQA